MYSLSELGAYDWLAHRAALSPTGVAITDGDDALSWQVWNARADSLAQTMRGLPDGPVALQLQGAAAVAVALGAAWKARRMIVPFNPRWTDQQREERLRQLAPAVTLVETRGSAVSGVEIVVSAGVILPEYTPPAARGLRIEELVQSAAASATLLDSWVGVGADERPVLGLFTSGTTGTPKLALLSARALVASALAGTHAIGVVGRGQAWAACMPLFHVGGLSILVRAMVRGLRVVVQEPTVASLSGVQNWSFISLVPTVLQRLVAADVPAPDALVATLVGGGPATGELLRSAAALGWRPRFSYGMTETAAHMTLAPEGSAGAGSRTVGWAIPGVHLTLRDAGPDGVGEFVVTGPTLMLGYRGHAPLHGEFTTGDAGRLDQEWGFELVDRRCDLIVTGGENVYPQQVEDVLFTHPAVAAAAVVGVSDDEWGQTVAAVVEWAEQPLEFDELAAWLKQRIAGFSVPRVWRTVSSLPRTATGKVQRSACRLLFRPEPGSGDGADVDPGDAKAE
jgi:O-succinylbenzoic acid--CoA ligase